MSIDPILISKDNTGGLIAVGDAKDAVGDGLGHYNIIMFAAAEFPPPHEHLARAPTNAMVCYVPLSKKADHEAISREEVIMASRAAEFAAKAFLENRPVLITCWNGKNRAPLIAAIALHLLDTKGCSGAAAMRIVRAQRHAFRSRRESVLSNTSYVHLLEALTPDGDSRAGYAARDPNRPLIFAP